MAHVLVVDDDDAIREAMRWALEESGHEVSEAPCGRSALELLHASPHQLVVILDLVMQDGDGLGVLNAIRDDALLASRHSYLVLTAMASSHLHLPDTLQCLLALPMITKPVETDDLLAAVALAATRLPATRHMPQHKRRGVS